MPESEKNNHKKRKEEKGRLFCRQKGDIVNIVHTGDGNINAGDLAEYKVEIKYLKKMLEEYKRVVQTKDEEISLLKSMLSPTKIS